MLPGVLLQHSSWKSPPSETLQLIRMGPPVRAFLVALATKASLQFSKKPLHLLPLESPYHGLEPPFHRLPYISVDMRRLINKCIILTALVSIHLGLYFSPLVCLSSCTCRRLGAAFADAFGPALTPSQMTLQMPSDSLCRRLRR